MLEEGASPLPFRGERPMNVRFWRYLFWKRRVVSFLPMTTIFDPTIKTLSEENGLLSVISLDNPSFLT